MAHLQAVTGLDRARSVAHVDAAFALWHRRSARALDLTMLTAAGIGLAVQPDADGRAGQAERRAAQHRAP